MNLKEIKKFIADAVEQASDITVIYANQSAPKPKTNYATVLVTPITKVGYDAITYKNDIGSDLDETIEGLREVKASINFFREDALQNAYDFISKLQSTSFIELFKASNIGFKIVSDVRDLSEIHKEFWEERAQIDLTVYVMSIISETVIATETMEINGEVESGNKVTDININLTN